MDPVYPLTQTLGELARVGSGQNVLLSNLTESDIARFIELTTARAPAASLVTAIFARHVVLRAPGNVEERLTIATEMMEFARKVDDKELILRGHLWRWVPIGLEPGLIESLVWLQQRHSSP